MPAFSFSGGEAHGRALLESALAEPRQTFGGRYLHQMGYEKGAALFRSLVQNHSLFDGNKRLALACLFVFLVDNKVAFYVSRDEAVRFALKVASEDTTVKDIASWIRRHAVGPTMFEGKARWDVAKLARVTEILGESTPRVRLLTEAIKRDTKRLQLETKAIKRDTKRLQRGTKAIRDHLENARRKGQE
jgi:death-on-curing protein